MQQLSEEGRARLVEIANRHGFSFDAVEHLLMAVIAGHGNQAQFNHFDLGGMGQWSYGGMIMIGDMFNNGLKARVDSLCTELSNLVRSSTDLMRAPASFQSQTQGGGFSGTDSFGSGVSLFVPGSSASGTWWPADLGYAASTGAQNNLRYAFFPASRRLAIDIGGHVTVYDTGDHAIGGFSQQQGGDQTLSFTSQYGLVRVADLPVISPVQETPHQIPAPVVMPETPVAAPSPAAAPPTETIATRSPAAETTNSSSEDDIFDKIERLAELHAKGILTEAEYQTKKAELLARL